MQCLHFRSDPSLDVVVRGQAWASVSVSVSVLSTLTLS